MLVKESYLRKIIKESLLLEAVYKLNQLKSLSPELYDLINKQFIIINSTFTLENDKSPGRFFIDILYQCMRELLGEFDPADPSDSARLAEKIENICVQLILLYQYKETTSSIVQSGETFRDYIYAFMLNPTKFMINDLEDMPINDMITKLKYVYTNVMNKARISGPDRVMQFKNMIKKKDTYYPFGDKLVDGKYFVVCPLSMMSSIFWARTNVVGEDIVLPQQDDISWCTARFTGGNMFNTYFVAGGTNLFYFLPKDDNIGLKKFCVGITKLKESGVEELVMGGHTTVNFENEPIIQKEQVISKNLLQQVSRQLNVSMKTMDKLVEEMASKEPMDKYKYVSMLDLEQFAAATNLDTLAPADENGERDYQDLDNVSQQIENVLKVYKDPEYTNRGYKSDPKILRYVDKNWDMWKDAGVTISLKYLPDSKKISNSELILKNIKDIDSSQIAYASDDLINDKQFILNALNIDAAVSRYIHGDILNDREFILNILNIATTRLKNEEINKFYASQYCGFFDNLPDNFKNDEEIIGLILDINAMYYSEMPAKIKNNYNLALRAVKSNGDTIRYMPDAFKNDPEIIKLALDYNLENIAYASHLRNNKQFILSILKEKRLKRKNTEDLGKCVIMVSYIDSKLLRDEEVALAFLNDLLWADENIFYADPDNIHYIFTKIDHAQDQKNYDYELIKKCNSIFNFTYFMNESQEREAALLFQKQYRLVNYITYLFLTSKSKDYDGALEEVVELTGPISVHKALAETKGFTVYNPKEFDYTCRLNNTVLIPKTETMDESFKKSRKLIMTESEFKKLLKRLVNY